MRLGIFPFVGAGHLNPLCTLGRHLQARGHDVTVFQMPIARAAVKTAGLKFSPIQPLPEEAPSRAKNAETKGACTWFTPLARSFSSVDALHTHAHRVLRRAPDAVRSAGLDALLVDQHDLAAGSVAELLGLPFITISLSPPVYLNDFTPFSAFRWAPGTGYLARVRNHLGNAVVGSMLSPVMSTVNQQRREWGLPELRHVNDVFSKLAIITQLPEALEFPSPHRPAHIFYAGPFHDGEGRAKVDFPWHRLDGRPLIYASMGTILTDMTWIFHIIAEACSTLEVQLVLSLGGGEVLPEDLPPFPGDPVIVHFAPQMEVLRKAKAVITHAGLNTTLESLAQGVPLIAIPIAHDQPGVAARIKRAGAGMVIPLLQLSARRLRQSLRTIIKDPAYSAAALRLQQAFHNANGLEYATQLVERVLADCKASNQQGLGPDSYPYGMSSPQPHRTALN